MTTFEIIVIVLLAVIVILLVLVFAGMATVNAKMQEGFQYLGKKILDCNTKLSYINDATQDISRQLDNIESNNDQDFEKLTDIVDKMHRNLCVDIADKMVDRVYPPTYNPPCYAPNGICTNPQMDCINCPKRGSGGTWSTNTSIKAKGEMFQEKFNDNKED